MGNIQTGIDYVLHKDVVPHPHKPSKFDPLYGFPEGRSEKVMKVSYEEMHAAKIPLEDRDYCAHKLIEYHACRREKFPWVVRCHHEKHAYLSCQYAEVLDRMKDFERERRLLEREKRLGKQERSSPSG